jgi:hypothetical protein
MKLNDKDLPEQNMNDFFRYLKDFCKQKKKEKFVMSRLALDVKKEDIIIFEADIDKVDFKLNDGKKRKALTIPTNNIFIEIPKWKIEDKKSLLVNLGGILLYEQIIDGIKLITAKAFWMHYNKELGLSFLKPTTILFDDEINTEEIDTNEKDIIWAGSDAKENQKIEHVVGVEDKLKVEMSSIIKNIIIFILLKIEKKEYTSYKKWTPRGFEKKEIVYSHEVSKHKRHFWKDSGRFKIPLMSKQELVEKGYGTDEVVFRDGEVRRDVPFKIIGNFLVGEGKEKKEDNRRISVAKGRIWRSEQKVYNILKEIYPDKIIRRHDRRTLKGLELDFNLPGLRLGIEYDGEQHFDRRVCEEVFHSDFDAQVRRDRMKNQRCRRKKIKLIRIKYDEPLTKTHIKKKLKAFGMI